MTDKAEEFATPSSPEPPELPDMETLGMAEYEEELNPRLASSPETPAELTEALNTFANEAFENGCRYQRDEVNYSPASILAARAALETIYNRQREEGSDLGPHYAALRKRFDEVSSQLERLKAEQITPEEAANVLKLIPRGWLEEECAKLRLRSLSDQKND